MTIQTMGRRIGRLLALALAFTAAAAAQAHLPEFFGRKYVLEVSDAQTEEEPRCGGDRSAMRAQAAELQAALEMRALAEGAYSAGLAEPYGELATLYAQLCNHPAALDSLRGAIQSLRIADGLLTHAQLPYLRALSESYAAIGDYRSAQQTLRTAFRVHGMGQGELDAQALRDSLDYFALARHVFIDPRSRGNVALFVEAYEDNADMLDAQRERGELAYADFESLAFSQLRNLYLLLGTELDTAAGISGGATNPAMDFLQRAQVLTYGKGRDLLEELIERAAAEPDPTRADLHFRLGNWHQWNAKWQRSCESYARAWELAHGEDGVALREQLASAAELPEDPALWASLLDSDIAVSARVEADFRVSARGDVSRVDASIVGDGSSGLAGRLARWLRDSHARPAVVDGVCVDSKLSGRRYRLLD